MKRKRALENAESIIHFAAFSFSLIKLSMLHAVHVPLYIKQRLSFSVFIIIPLLSPLAIFDICQPYSPYCHQRSQCVYIVTMKTSRAFGKLLRREFFFLGLFICFETISVSSVYCKRWFNVCLRSHAFFSFFSFIGKNSDYKPSEQETERGKKRQNDI